MAYTNFYGFIDADYVKNNSTVCGQMEDSFIEPFIQIAQEKYIIDILSSGLYNDMQLKVEAYLNSGTAIPSNYVSLLNNYVKNCLLHWVLYEMIPQISFHIGNIGIIQKNSEYGTSSDISGTEYIRNTIRSTAQFYHDRLKKHMVAEGKTTYPLYNESYNNTDGTLAKDSDTNLGIYFE